MEEKGEPKAKVDIQASALLWNKFIWLHRHTAHPYLLTHRAEELDRHDVGLMTGNHEAAWEVTSVDTTA